VLCTLLVFNSAIAAEPVSGLAFDINAPVIQHEPASQTVVSDQKLVVSAEVSDESGVASVKIYYRFDHAGTFQAIDLAPLDNNQYSITLDDELSISTFEYILQAKDSGGNTVTQGSQVDPLRFDVTAVSLGLEDQNSVGESNTLWWVLGGAAVLGLALSGGGGSDNPTPKTGTVTFGGTAP